jgi:DNA-binding transcriptional ArsR family regulator
MVEVLSTAERIYGRTDAALSALALAGPAGMPQDEFFRSVYGFAFSPNIHRGSFNVLVHRMRNRVRGLGDVLRGDDRLALRIDRAFVVPDPRCVEPTVARVLRLLASRGACRAEELAQNLNVSQRTVQLALQQLLADGACQKERNGREIRYRVDDTTFCEPTPWAGTAPPAER